MRSSWGCHVRYLDSGNPIDFITERVCRNMVALEAHDITKAFPGVVALRDVDVLFKGGSVHAIMGENGAGKSTLVKILSGVYNPNKGKVLVDGKDALGNPGLFERVAYVPQELDLFSHMTVAENLFIPFWKAGFKGMVREEKLFEAAIPWLEKFQINATPSDLVKDISISDQQLLQIARATVNKYAEIFILDEPTTSLTLKDMARLFEVIRQLKDEGKAIIFISHKLDEVFEICDEITILRNGEKVGYAEIKEVDRRWVISKMSGRDVDEEIHYRPESKSDEVILEVKNLSGRGFSNINFTLRKGEILGFAGLVGAGRSEIMQTVFGLLPVRSGTVTLEGQKWKLGDTSYSIRNGLSYLPEERRQQGLLPLLSVRENIGVSLIHQIAQGLAISGKKEQSLAEEIVEAYDIKTPSIEQQIMFLSGGNQQKVIIGRSIYCMPKVIIFDEPTKGIDVGTKSDLYRIMRNLAEEKDISIILVSSELDELMRCSNRIITIYQGSKAGEFDPEKTSRTEIISSMIGEGMKCNMERVQ